MRKAVIYARISQDRTGEAIGVARQREECERLIEAHRWDVVDTIVENDVSATRGKRPGFTRLLSLIEQGAADTVVYWHQDRLSRGVRDLAALLDLRRVCPSLALVPVQGQPIYADDPSGRMTAEILASVAGHEAARIGSRVKARQAQHREAGDLPRRTYGYGSDAQPVEPAASAVRAAYAALLRTESIAAAQRAVIEADPSAPSSRTAIRALLTRPAYAGIPSAGGVERADWPANWEPLIALQDYRAVQAILSRPSRRYAKHNRRARIALGSGLYRCGRCGAAMGQSRITGGSRVYTCATGNDHLRRKADPVDRYVLGLVLARLGMLDTQATILPRSPDPDAPALVEQYESLTRRIAQMTDAMADGLLDAGPALAAITRLRADREDVEDRLAVAGVTGQEGAEDYVNPLDTVVRAPLSAIRTVAHTLAEIVLMPVPLGSPKGLPRGALRPFAGGVTVRWRDEVPEPLRDSLESEPLDLTSIGIVDDIPAEFALARDVARAEAPVLSIDQRRVIWTALMPYAQV